jgi:hypothetical protein
LSEDVLLRLIAKTTHSGTVEEISKRASLTPAVMTKIAEASTKMSLSIKKLVLRTDLPTDAMQFLVKSISTGNRKALASRRDIPAFILDQLKVDKNESVREEASK